MCAGPACISFQSGLAEHSETETLLRIGCCSSSLRFAVVPTNNYAIDCGPGHAVLRENLRVQLDFTRKVFTAFQL